MERYNPFSTSNIVSDDSASPLTKSFNSSISSSATNIASPSTKLIGGSSFKQDNIKKELSVESSVSKTSRYSTSFPDPLGDLLADDAIKSSSSSMATTTKAKPSIGARTASVNFASPSSYDANSTSETSPNYPKTTGSRQANPQAGGFTSFLSRATSVTSSSVTDRVSGAMDSMKSAVDNLSNQIQQAVPTNLNINERLSSTASNLIGSGDQLQQQLASKFSSATAQFTSSGSQQNSLPVISRQRVILIIDNPATIDWVQKFTNYHRLTTGTSQSSQSVFSSLFTTATAQLSYSSNANEGGDLIEQAHLKDITVSTNQSSATATVCITNNARLASSTSGSPSHNIRRASTQAIKIVRPEYVVIRQRVKLDELDHLKGIVKGLTHSLIPTFEPTEIWSMFQDRQLISSRLLHIQQMLGRENFPLIPQVYSQTHQDLLNYIQSSNIKFPCLARIGSKGKIKIDSIHMLKDLASILATIKLGCTLEPYLCVKYDMIVQKLGTNLKLYRRLNVDNLSKSDSIAITEERGNFGTFPSSPSQGVRSISDLQQSQQQSGPTSTTTSTPTSKVSVGSRQNSMASGVLSGFVSGSQFYQPERRDSSRNVLSSFERMNDVNSRYRNWLDAVSHEFDGKLEAFRLKLVVTDEDREYVVGLDNCSMDFVGNSFNRDEDERAFVELVISHMNTVLPKYNSQSSSSNINSRQQIDDVANDKSADSFEQASRADLRSPLASANILTSSDKRKFASQSQINNDPYQLSPSRSSKSTGIGSLNSSPAYARNQGRLGNRSQSVSMNQSDFMYDDSGDLASKTSVHANRRGSDRLDKSARILRNDSGSPSIESSDTVSSGLLMQMGGSSSQGIYQRQASLGQSFFDQTSSALSSFQRSSLSFFKRLDSRSDGAMMGTTNTPPQSAKSDRGFIVEHGSFVSAGLGSEQQQHRKNSANRDNVSNGQGDMKSRSVDLPSSSAKVRMFGRDREAPQKPPPPRTPIRTSFQSSTEFGSRHPVGQAQITPNSTPNQTRHNSLASSTDGLDSSGHQQSRGRVVRQNSALSAFEPFDSDLSKNANPSFASVEPIGSNKARPTSQLDQSSTTSTEAAATITDWQSFRDQDSNLTGHQKASSFNSGSITSGDSTSTADTTTTSGDDTMKNLKKTFAGIFGDKPSE